MGWIVTERYLVVVRVVGEVEGFGAVGLILAKVQIWDWALWDVGLSCVGTSTEDTSLAGLQVRGHCCHGDGEKLRGFS